MSKLTIALLREEKIPVDTRVAFSPVQCQWLMNKYPGLEIFVQPCENRCYKDDEYRHEDVEVREDVSGADLLMGVKEVPKEKLVAGKKYLFFSHTIKKQPQNQQLLKTVLKNNIQLIDYECLVWENGERILGFGHFAGVVGAHNAFVTYGKRYKLFDLKPAYACSDYDKLIDAYKDIRLPAMKIAVTGTGRVAKGAYELLEKLNLRMISIQNYLTKEFDEPVYVVLNTAQLYESKNGKPFNRNEFHHHPENYTSAFLPFTNVTNIFINAIFWDPKAPVFFSKDDMRRSDFRIKVIADVTCDVNGSVPATIRDTTIESPVFGYNPATEKEDTPYQPQVIDVMAVSNLPNELPREASSEFGDKLIEYVVEELLLENSEIISRATIAKDGSLTQRFQYLEDYANG
ncbi:MAG: alanine dehydrogenase [Chitinophagaceae bacterium]|nr:alanine dehydrogenase [Chitinophagaceae bacterium]